MLDILSELEPRLGSLEKQAKRAMDYERIRADLRLLLRDWYGYHWHRMQQEVVHTREVLHAQEARLERARERQAEVEVQLTNCAAKLQALRERSEYLACQLGRAAHPVGKGQPRPGGDG